MAGVAGALGFRRLCSKAGQKSRRTPSPPSGLPGPVFTVVTHDWASHAFGFCFALATPIPEQTGQSEWERNSSQRLTEEGVGPRGQGEILDRCYGLCIPIAK